MTYKICNLKTNISPQDLADLRRGNFNELKDVITPESSPEGSIPLRRSPIEWNPSKGHMLSSLFLEKFHYPYRRYVKDLLIEGFNRELQLFAISLDAYIESNFEIPVEKIIYLASLGPEGSSILKKARKELFKKKIDAINFADSPLDPRVEDLIKDLQLTDIDNVFNYRHMPLWEERPTDLEDYSQIPVEVDQVVIDEFRSTLRGLISDIRVNPEDTRVEILLQSTRSKSLDNKEKIFHFLKPQKSLHVNDKNFSNSIGTCVRTIVPVYPQSFRDAVIVDWRSRNSIQFIETRVRNILRKLPYHNFTDDNVRFYNSTRRFYTYGYVYVCRDIKKEGLTKPRYLLKIMLEELSKIDPLLTEYINFYEDFNVEGFSEVLRGHGQGMANSLTTLMQVVIIQMVNNFLISNGFDEQITSLCYNDDNITRVPEDILDEFWDIEGEIMKGLGLLRADDKSFHSKLGYIYCEQYISPYYPEANQKQMVSRRNVLFSFLYDFSYEVKEYLKSISNNSYLKTYLKEIILTFGYEFFPEEIEYPLSLGGWIPDRIYGLSDAILALDNLDYDIRVYCMYRASKIIRAKYPLPKRVLSKNRRKISFLERIFPGYKYEIGKYLPIGTYKDLYYKYQLYRDDPSLDFKFRKNISELRKKRFRERVDILPTLQEFQLELAREKKYILPRQFCKFKDPTIFVTNIERDPYKQDTPIENYLSKIVPLNIYRSPYREEYSISETEFSFHLRKDERYFTSPEEEKEELLGIPFEEESFYSVDKVVGNTAIFLLAHYKYYGQLPVVEGLEDHPYKEEVYGRLLTMEEYIEYSNLTYSRWNFVLDERLFRLLEESGLDEETLETLTAEVKEELRPVNVDEPSDESDDDLITEEEEERIRNSLLKKRGRLKSLDIDSLQAILLARSEPDEYEYGEILSDLVAPVIFFYNSHDSLLGTDRHSKLREAFEKSGFLENETLKALLVSACEDGYLREIGESLGLYIPSDSDEDFGLSTMEAGIF